ncbi:MAG: DNA gyrase subunit A [Verrucomicrobia bacterium]|nr:DNA gyrase subunit A [Verrucomicrobiota bacterium]MCG2679039.1 DNA gyrase subunit A [Kiritimatiellia bacterium]MBU4247845.1 DNA gyrase subunit A [Verrucomicrobiota bacterium]MBU4291654.1 DNA gyrase subunit A [Verrucomicrobiota bacterium]MBU4427827.1 DNA gyrase subunit A [Verrucomicrobiota bacterium]
MYTQNEIVGNINIEDEMQRSYIDYSMSVIIGRALPDVRDGMKPGARRILFAMWQLGLMHNRPFKKCAYVVGEVLGKYHPHGDTAVYDTLVRMAQPFSLRYMLVDGQGNFGSIDGDNAAAYRYTESRLQKIAEEMLVDIDKRTVPMVKNYNGELDEPSVLPARLPNLLLNGSTGIAVGMATNIPPHNLGEVVDALIVLIDNPEATIEDLMKHVKGPDFPTGAIICGKQPILSMYKTGRGQIHVRGRAGIEEGKQGKECIIVSEIPYTVNKASLIEHIAELVNDKTLEGIGDIRDESNKDGIRVVIELKRGSIPKVILNNLFKHTQLQTTFGAIMLAIDHGRPKVLNLKEILQCFIAHRFTVITRRTQFDLEKAEARAHILEGLKIALANLDAIVKIIKSSKNRDMARDELIKRFGLSEIQANAILDMRLYQLTGLERDKLEAEYLELIKLISYLKDLLANKEKIYGLMKIDLLEIKEQYGDARRTEIVPDEGEVNIEDLIADRSCIITISHTGYIKRVPVGTYKAQRRGGKGVAGMETKEEDFVEHLFVATTHDYILFFTTGGRIYWEKVYEIPEAGRTARGKAIVNLLELKSDEQIAAMVRVRAFPETEFLVMATEKGVVKKTNLSEFANPRRDGIIAINIDPGDRLIGVKLTSGQNDVMLASRKGMSLRFNESELKDQGRATRGVIGIRLDKDDKLENLEIVDPKATFFICTENGYGKRTSFNEYRDQHRGGKGIYSIRSSDRNGAVVGAHTVMEKDCLMLITAKGKMIRMQVSDIRVISRVTQGVRLIDLDEGDTLVSATTVEPEDENLINGHESNGNGAAKTENGEPAAPPASENPPTKAKGTL